MVYGNYVDYTPFYCKRCGTFFAAPYKDADVICPNCDAFLKSDVEEAENRRVCSHCGKIIREGYIIHNGEAYYCSDECLHQHMTEKEYMEEYNLGDDTYWTDWSNS